MERVGELVVRRDALVRRMHEVTELESVVYSEFAYGLMDRMFFDTKLVAETLTDDQLLVIQDTRSMFRERSSAQAREAVQNLFDQDWFVEFWIKSGIAFFFKPSHNWIAQHVDARQTLPKDFQKTICELMLNGRLQRITVERYKLLRNDFDDVKRQTLGAIGALTVQLSSECERASRDRCELTEDEASANHMKTA
jgi:hypothetical protein